MEGSFAIVLVATVCAVTFDTGIRLFCFVSPGMKFADIGCIGTITVVGISPVVIPCLPPFAPTVPLPTDPAEPFVFCCFSWVLR
uniref:Uncharacterized protein n=1 Tax=Anopheles darlingi TaxID=43151 RepID=A0A2M4DQT8_ANODA